MKKFAAFDIDGTIFRSSLVAELLLMGIQRGIFGQEAYGEFATPYERWRKRQDEHAYDTFIEALVQSYLRHIKGLSEEHIDVLADSVIERLAEYTHVYTKQLAAKLKAEGYFLIAISGSPSELVSRFAQKYQFDAYVAAEYERRKGIYTGNATPAHTGKDRILQTLAEQHNLSFKDSYAVGDSPGDIGMLQLVDNPIAFNPDDKLFEAARQHGWKVVIERKNMVYELEDQNGSYILAQTTR